MQRLRTFIGADDKPVRVAEADADAWQQQEQAAGRPVRPAVAYLDADRNPVHVLESDVPEYERQAAAEGRALERARPVLVADEPIYVGDSRRDAFLQDYRTRPEWEADRQELRKQAKATAVGPGPGLPVVAGLKGLVAQTGRNLVRPGGPDVSGMDPGSVAAGFEATLLDIVGGAGAGGAALLEPVVGAAEFYTERAGLKDPNVPSASRRVLEGIKQGSAELQGSARQLTGEQGLAGDVAHGVAKAAGGLAATLPAYGAGKVMGMANLPAIAAFEASSTGDPRKVAQAAAQGLAMQGVITGVAPLPRIARVPAAAYGGGAVATIGGEDLDEIITSAVMAGGLSALGPKGSLENSEAVQIIARSQAWRKLTIRERGLVLRQVVTTQRADALRELGVPEEIAQQIERELAAQGRRVQQKPVVTGKGGQLERDLAAEGIGGGYKPQTQGQRLRTTLRQDVDGRRAFDEATQRSRGPGVPGNGGGASAGPTVPPVRNVGPQPPAPGAPPVRNVGPQPAVPGVPVNGGGASPSTGSGQAAGPTVPGMGARPPAGAMVPAARRELPHSLDPKAARDWYKQAFPGATGSSTFRRDAARFQQGWLQTALEMRQPVSAAALETYGMQPPAGYVLKAGKWVFKGTPEQRAAKLPAQIEALRPGSGQAPVGPLTREQVRAEAEAELRKQAGFPIQRNRAVLVRLRADGKAYSKPIRAQVIEVQGGGMVRVRFSAPGSTSAKVEDVNFNRLAELPSLKGQRIRGEMLAALPADERARVVAAERELKQLLATSQEFYEPTAEDFIENAMGDRAKAKQQAVYLQWQIEQAAAMAGVKDIDVKSPIDRARLLPLVKAALAKVRAAGQSGGGAVGQSGGGNGGGASAGPTIQRTPYPVNGTIDTAEMRPGDLAYVDGQWHLVEQDEVETKLKGDFIRSYETGEIAPVENLVRATDPAYEMAMKEFQRQEILKAANAENDMQEGEEVISDQLPVTSGEAPAEIVAPKKTITPVQAQKAQTSMEQAGTRIIPDSEAEARVQREMDALGVTERVVDDDVWARQQAMAMKYGRLPAPMMIDPQNRIISRKRTLKPITVIRGKAHELGHQIDKDKGVMVQLADALDKQGLDDLGALMTETLERSPDGVDEPVWRKGLRSADQNGIAGEAVAEAIGLRMVNPIEFARRYPSVASALDRILGQPQQARAPAPRLIPRKPDGSMGPYSEMTEKQTIDHVKYGEKPSALFGGDDAESKALVKIAQAYDLPHAILPGRKTGEFTFYVAKDQATLDALIKVHTNMRPDGLVVDEYAEGRLLGYTDADLEAFRLNREDMISKGSKLPRLPPVNAPAAADEAGIAKHMKRGLSRQAAIAAWEGEQGQLRTDAQGVRPNIADLPAPTVGEIQAGYKGPDTVANGERPAGFTDDPREVQEAIALGLTITPAGGQFSVYSRTPADAAALAKQLSRYGYGQNNEQRAQLSRLAGYSEEQVAEFVKFLEAKAVDPAPAGGTVFPRRPANKSQFTRQPLSVYGPVMYRQATQVELEKLLGRDGAAERNSLMVSNTPELALSQQPQANILIEFDATGITGWPNTDKPDWERLYDQNMGEFFALADNDKPVKWVDHIRAITIGTLDLSDVPAEHRAVMQHNRTIGLANAIRALKGFDAGVTNEDGSITLRRESAPAPAEGTAAPQAAALQGNGSLMGDAEPFNLVSDPVKAVGQSGGETAPAGPAAVQQELLLDGAVKQAEAMELEAPDVADLRAALQQSMRAESAQGKYLIREVDDGDWLVTVEDNRTQARMVVARGKMAFEDAVNAAITDYKGEFPTKTEALAKLDALLNLAPDGSVIREELLKAHKTISGTPEDYRDVFRKFPAVLAMFTKKVQAAAAAAAMPEWNDAEQFARDILEISVDHNTTQAKRSRGLTTADRNRLEKAFQAVVAKYGVDTQWAMDAAHEAGYYGEKQPSDLFSRVLTWIQLNPPLARNQAAALEGFDLRPAAAGSMGTGAEKAEREAAWQREMSARKESGWTPGKAGGSGGSGVHGYPAAPMNGGAASGNGGGASAGPTGDGTYGGPMDAASGGPLGTPGEAVPVEDNPNFSAFALEMPEVVEMARMLLGGSYPKLRQKLISVNGGQAAGLFRHSRMNPELFSIELLNTIFMLVQPQERAVMMQEAAQWVEDNADPRATAKERIRMTEERYKHELERETQARMAHNPKWATKVLTHEIGHLVDYLEAHMIDGRGNILGHIAALHRYLKGAIAGFPGGPEKVTVAEKKELAKLAKQRALDELGPERTIIEELVTEVPEFAALGVTVDDIKALLGSNARESTPELYDWFAQRSRDEKKEILRAAMRGLLDERVLAQQFVSKVQTGVKRVVTQNTRKVGATKAEISKRFQELLARKIKDLRLIELAQIKKEMAGAIAWWRGTGTTPDRMEAYFKPPAEMYAEAFSIFLANPKALAKRAPTAYRAFMAYMSARPVVQDEYTNLMEAIKSGTVMKDRVLRLRESFGIRRENLLRMARKEASGFTWREQKMAMVATVDRRMGPIYMIIHAADPEMDRPKSGALHKAVKDYLHQGTKIQEFLMDINAQVLTDLKDSDLDWVDMAEYLFHQRVIHERYDLGNPQGWTPKNSIERLGAWRAQLGPDTWRILEDASKKFRRIYENGPLALLEGERMLDPDLMDHLKKNIHYATFAVTDSGMELTKKLGIDAAQTKREIEARQLSAALIKRYGEGVTGHIFKQFGTVQDIRNPATASVAKAISLMHMVYRNRLARLMGEYLIQTQDPQARRAEYTYNGKYRVPVIVNTSRIGTLIWMREGKLTAIYAPAALVNSLKGGALQPDLAAIWRSLRGLNNIFKGMMTRFHPGFWSRAYRRDQRSYVFHMPGAVGPGLIAELIPLPNRWLPSILFRDNQKFAHYERKAWKAAASLGRGDPDEVARKFLDRMMGISRAQFLGDVSEDTDLERMMLQLNIMPRSLQPGDMKGLRRVRMALNSSASWYLGRGEQREVTAKIVGMLMLDETQPNMPEWRKQQLVTEMSGSPDFLEFGRANPLIDFGVTSFFNARKEGLRSEWRSFKNDRGEWARKRLQYTVAPELLRWSLASGALLALAAFLRKKYGAKEETQFEKTLTVYKEMYDAIPDYYKMTYACYPITWVDAAHTKLLFITMVLEDSEQKLHAAMWAGLDEAGQQAGLNPQVDGSLAAIQSNLSGDLPMLGRGGPLVASLMPFIEYNRGMNPNDSLTGQPLMTDDQFKAKGWYAQKRLWDNAYNSSGIGGLLGRARPEELSASKRHWAEKLLRFPGISETVGRWVRITDRGIPEDIRQREAPQLRADARTREDVKRGMREALENDGTIPEWAVQRMLNDSYFYEYWQSTRTRIMEEAALTPAEKAIVRPTNKRTQANAIEQGIE